MYEGPINVIQTTINDTHALVATSKKYTHDEMFEIQSYKRFFLNELLVLFKQKQLEAPYVRYPVNSVDIVDYYKVCLMVCDNYPPQNRSKMGIQEDFFDIGIAVCDEIINQIC